MTAQTNELKPCRVAFEAELNNPKREKIYNNGRYFDTQEVYELWQIAYNLGTSDTTLITALRDCRKEVLLAARWFELNKSEPTTSSDIASMAERMKSTIQSIDKVLEGK